MSVITLTKQEMQEVLDGDYIKGEFEKHHRHNGGYQTIVFKRDGKHYETTYTTWEEEGIEWEDGYTAVEVEKSTKIIEYWKPV